MMGSYCSEVGRLNVHKCEWADGHFCLKTLHDHNSTCSSPVTHRRMAKVIFPDRSRYSCSAHQCRQPSVDSIAERLESPSMRFRPRTQAHSQMTSAAACGLTQSVTVAKIARWKTSGRSSYARLCTYRSPHNRQVTIAAAT